MTTLGLPRSPAAKRIVAKYGIAYVVYAAIWACLFVVAVIGEAIHQLSMHPGLDWAEIVLVTRWVSAVALGSLSLLIGMADTLYCLISYTPRDRETHVTSPYPPLWGLIGALALVLCPLRYAWCFFWLPVAWDLGTYPVRQRRYADACLTLEKAKAEAGDCEARGRYERMLAAKEEWLAKRP
jgi:hypothetical protein